MRSGRSDGSWRKGYPTTAATPRGPQYNEASKEGHEEAIRTRAHRGSCDGAGQGARRRSRSHDLSDAYQLSPEHEEFRKVIRDFALNEVAPRAAEIDQTNIFPRDLWPAMGELGLHGITVEEEYGGADMGYLAHVVAMEEVSRGSASVGLSYGAH